MNAYTESACQLFHDGILAFADMEYRGIAVDLDYCTRKEKEISNTIDRLKNKLLKSTLIKKWKHRYRSKFNMNSNTQLATMLFKVMGIKSEKTTTGGNAAVDQEALEKLKMPEVDLILKIRKLQKMRTTYLMGLVREEVNGFIHPHFNLHTTKTYRSSSNAPNFQNFPVRDPEMAELIRQVIIPRPGRQLLEIDYSGIEVCVAACYHKDPNMFTYINDSTKDMHRDMAMQCYKLLEKEVTKDIRWWGKSGFVFPQFYGDYYANNAKYMWDAISSSNLETVSGIPLRRHLKRKGIKKFSEFENHLKHVEDHFWNVRFPVYKRWKDTWYSKYVKKGYFDSLTGFRCSGLMSKNDVINYPVQGAAFHCLLWSLIRIAKALRKYKMKSIIIGQIHDSIVSDVVPSELNDVLEISHNIMCKRIRERWRWIIVPLEIEAEVTGVDESWFSKKEIAIGG